ncbi:MAG: RNA-binding protein [Desulfobacterota bacterium]|nr:RNA-binding protein [Thermodesulfobacteriota bacterium]
MGKKLYVGNLSYKVTEDDLKKKFGEVGECVSANIVMDKFSGQSRGFGFVEMASDELAQEAIKKLNNVALYGRGIVVNEAKPQTDRKGPRRQGGGFKGHRSF